MLNTKYQSSGHFAFREEDFLGFHLENLFLAYVTYYPKPFERFL